MPTRFYFRTTEAAAISPGYAAWGYTTEALRRRMVVAKSGDAITLGSQIGPWTATIGFTALDRQYVSDPIAAQTISGTFGLQLMVREYATGDNVNSLYLCIKVVDSTGALRANIATLGYYGPTPLEFISNTTHRNKTGAYSDAFTAVNALAGDRIVVEIGYACSVACTTPEASAKWGDNATDLPVNETQTTDGAGWLEFSGTIQWPAAVVTGAASPSGKGSTAAAALAIILAGAQPSGKGGVAASGTVIGGAGIVEGAATLQAKGALTSAALNIALAGVALQGKSQLAAAALNVALAGATLQGKGGLVGSGIIIELAVASLQGAGQATPTALVIAFGGATLQGTGHIMAGEPATGAHMVKHMMTFHVGGGG